MWRRRPNRRWVLLRTGTQLSLVLLITLVLFLSGCVSWQSTDGTRHTLVLGLGLVSTKTNADNSATATRCTTIGLTVQGGHPPSGLVVGYQNLQQTAISPEWQGIVQIDAAPGKPLTVEGHGPDLPAAVPATRMRKEEEVP